MVSAIVIGAMLLVYIMISFLNLVYLQELNALKVEKSQIEKNVSSLQKYEVMFNSVKDYENLIKNAVSNTPEWEIILGDLGETLLEGIWFDDISLKHENNMVKCVIKGKAVGQDVVAKWITNVEDLRYMKSINCKHISELRENEKEYYQFEISADIASTEISTKASGKAE